jgi:multicomponent Na+:H+ antiporter subunit D
MSDSSTFSVVPLVAMLLPWVSLLAILAMPKKGKRLRMAVCFLGTLATFGVVLSLLPGILDGNTYTIKLASVVEGLEMRLTVDMLGYYFSLIVAFLWMLSTLYSVSYIDHKENRFFAFMALCESFILGCAFSSNMFTYFIFYEMMTFGSYPLIIHEETAMARRAGYKYLVYAVAAGTVLFFAIVAHYFWGDGQMGFGQNGVLSLEAAGRAALMVIFFTYLAGFGVKAAIMPLHGWVPDAHPAAPSPASALLSGVILKAGAFGIIRVVFNVFGVDLMRELSVFIVMAALACITIVVASVFALTQDNLKRRLAYSSIGQVSYIILGLAMLAQDGALGGVMHLTHHALMKGCLFLCAGIILVKTGKKNISDMKGVGYKLPITMICFSVCALAMMGTPPSVGFITKWLLGSGSLQAGLPIYILVLLVSALLNAAYFLPIIYIAFFRWEGDEEEGHEEGSRPRLVFGKEADHKLVAPVVVLALLAVIVGVWVTVPGFPYSLANPVISDIYEGSVTGYVYEDLDADGILDRGEPGREGVSVRLESEGKPVMTVSTGEDGMYSFENVEPGAYEVVIELSDGLGAGRSSHMLKVEIEPGEKAVLEEPFLIYVGDGEE